MTKIADFGLLKLPNLILSKTQVSQSGNLGTFHTFIRGIFSKFQNSGPLKGPKSQVHISYYRQI